MTVTREDGFTYVTYAEGKRPLKLGVFWIDRPEADAYLSRIIGFVVDAANKPEHIARMGPERFWKLVERLSTMFCRAYSPTRENGITKPEIRGAIYFVLLAGMDAGTWPTEYAISNETFVRRWLR